MPQRPRQQAPPVQWLRLRYAKRGRLRFTSHRDFSRAFQRALARAGVPMAYSSGFNPHPRISYAGAAPTGAASEAEYLEIGLAEPREAAQVRAVLDDALPAGLDVLEVVQSAGGALADQLEASRWRVSLSGPDATTVGEAVDTFRAAGTVTVGRMTKRGLRRFDCRGAVVEISSAAGSGTGRECAILEMVLRHGTPSVRPDDVLTGLCEHAGLETGSAPLYERLAQGPLDPRLGSVGDPLASDRDAAGRS